MPLTKKALVFSALGDDSGCALRARYLSDALRRQGWESECVSPGRRNLPLSVEAFLSVPRYIGIALFSKAGLAVGIKPYPNNWIALWLLRLKGATVVLDIDDMDSAWRGGVIGALGKMVQAPAFLLIRLFSTHHEGIRAWLARKGRVVSLKQGVDTTLFKPARLSSQKNLLFTAHMNIACQLDLLIECVAPWLKKHPDWTLTIAGGGPALDRFKRRHAGGQIRFTGALSPEQVAAWIQRSKICLSVYDGNRGNLFRVPMKCGEYLAAGKPVVSSMIPGLLNLKKFLYICEANSKSFSEQLDRLAVNRGDGREKRGSVWVKNNLSWDKVAVEFLGELT